MRALPEKLEQWQVAGLIDEATRQAILRYEATQQAPERRTWQVRVAMILGAVLLGAGILLFVAAHWDVLSPSARVALVLSTLTAIHVAAAFTAQRLPALSTSLHAVGTVASGAAIALLGQIFNMDEHWPSAVLVWALCALAGAVLLQDAAQRAFALLLTPLWLGCEWADRTARYAGANVYLGRFLVLLGCAFLAAFLAARQRGLFRILFATGAILVPAGIALLTEGWRSYPYPGSHFLPLAAQVFAWFVLLAVGAAAVLFARSSLLPVCTGLLLGLVLPWLVVTVHHSVPSLIGTQSWTETRPSVLFYLLVGLGSVALIYAGLRQHATALVNYGTVAFGATVLWFYFADVWDKLGRSFGLLLMGILFLLGGWLLERTRRHLLVTMERPA